ncbi:hypothetical protein SAMN04488137_1612 [Fictibacillus solisalsi]|uniref:Uncharacterized protein n=1 Tax=Fictibacillus solisalsi TaxID=459525 RepID=A0A1G9VIM2_9BACL|nr:hypothetical protein [Fictibacillus solisalsi]SDM72044.1 hypothetical protein SAMN04488137_1612 [Fictibacillus solisalsi]
MKEVNIYFVHGWGWIYHLGIWRENQARNGKGDYRKNDKPNHVTAYGVCHKESKGAL